MKRDAIVRVLAPVAPPCFETRSLWLSYCESAADEQRDDHKAGPLVFKRGVVRIVPEMDATAQRQHQAPPFLIEKGRTVRFNPDFSYCDECRAEWQADMKRAGRCKPTYLRDLLTEEA